MFGKGNGRVRKRLSDDKVYLLFNNRLIGLVGRVFANGLGDQGRVIPKTLKMVHHSQGCLLVLFEMQSRPRFELDSPCLFPLHHKILHIRIGFLILF